MIILHLSDFYSSIFEYWYNGNFDFLNPSNENNLRVSNLSSLFESFMAIGFGFFALARENSKVVQIMESSFKKRIEKLSDLKQKINTPSSTPSSTPSYTDVDSLSLELNLSKSIGKSESYLKEIFLDIRYNFLCLAVYCCLMLICCGLEELFIPQENSYTLLKNFIFNYSFFMILNSFRRVIVNDSIIEEKDNFMKESMLYIFAVILSCIFSYWFCSPMPIVVLSFIIIFSIFFPVILHIGQYQKLNWIVKRIETKIAEEFTFGKQ